MRFILTVDGNIHSNGDFFSQLFQMHVRSVETKMIKQECQAKRNFFFVVRDIYRKQSDNQIDKLPKVQT